MIVIWHADKWYINLFPAATEMNPSNNTMARPFQTEMTRMKVKGHSPFKKEEAENLWNSLTVWKRSILPEGNNYIILHIFNLNMLFKHKQIVFQSLMTKTMKITMMKMMKKDKENEEFVFYKNGGQSD